MENSVKNHSNKLKFVEYAYKEAERKKSVGCLGVASNYICAANRLKAFLMTRGKKDLSFKKMTALLMSDFEEWLRRQGCQRNTSATYLRNLRAIWGRAVKEGLVSGNPFEGTFRGVAKTRKRAISPDDIRRLRELDIEAAMQSTVRRQIPKDGKRFQGKQQRLIMARDLFVFCFCARGMTFVDLAYLRKADICDGVIRYVRRKTGQRIEVRVEPLMQEIMERYPSQTAFQFPILSEADGPEALYNKYLRSIHRYNKSLHQLGQLLGGLPLTSYVCRHSWATTAYTNNVGLPVISQALGHDSEKTTAIYLKSFEASKIDAANHDLIANVFGTKR